MLGYGAAGRLNSLDNHFPGFPEKPFGKLTQSWYPDPVLWDRPENWDVGLLRTQGTSGTKKKALCLSIITSGAGPSHVQRAAQRLASQHWETLFIAILHSYCNTIKLLLLLSTTRGCAVGEDAEPPPSIKRAPRLLSIGCFVQVGASSGNVTIYCWFWHSAWSVLVPSFDFFFKPVVTSRWFPH